MPGTIRPGLAAVSLLMICGPAAHAGAIERLTAGPDAMYAIRDGDVLTFDRRGAVVARCTRFAAPPSRRPPAPIGSPDPAETLRLGGLPDDDSTLQAEELLEDEGSPPRRRGGGEAIAQGLVPGVAPVVVPVAVPVLPRALAADGDGVWIATSDGLYRGGPGGCRRAGLAGRDLIAVATDGTTVVAASRDALFRGDAGPGGQLALGPSVPLPVAPRALAVDAQGGVLAAGDAGVVHAAPDGGIARVIDRPTGVLARCGQTVLALTDDAVMIWDGRRAARVAPRPPVRAAACATGRGWVAAGLGVWGSPDASAWAEVPEGLGLDLAAVVSLAGVLWVAAGDGLTPLQPQAELGAAGPCRCDPRPAPRRWRLGASAGWRLPLVTASLLIDQTPLRRSVTAMLLLTFPLGRSRLPGAAGDVGAEELRRDAGLAREEVALARLVDAAAGRPAGDQAAARLAGDEAAARLAAVREEREAPP